MKKRKLMDAHMPSWIKGKIRDIAAGDKKAGTYRTLGRAIGQRIEDFVEDADARFTKDEWKAMARFDGFTQRHELSETINPTATLRKLLANEEHPKGGDLILQIPPRRRGDFLAGIIDGLGER